MNFITHHQKMVIIAEICQMNQGVPVPADPGRIMGITKNKQFATLVIYFLQMAEIHTVGTIRISLQAIKYDLTTVTLWNKSERMIHRGLYDYLITQDG
jgi:hypothetical protein